MGCAEPCCCPPAVSHAEQLLSCFPAACAPSLLQNPVPNAYTLAIAGRKPFIVVHTALLELLTPAEVQVRAMPCLARPAKRCLASPLPCALVEPLLMAPPGALGAWPLGRWSRASSVLRACRGPQ